jgi:hypothetical protein
MVGYSGQTLLIESEKIFVTALTSSSQVSTCVHGAFGTTAIALLAGTAYRGIDPLHVNGTVTDQMLAQAIAANLNAQNGAGQ